MDDEKIFEEPIADDGTPVTPEGEVIVAPQTHSRIVENLSVENVMEDSFLRYSMSVIVDRALPDVRDGLKPVHRRILYSMGEQNLRPTGRFLKSARIIGDVMGKYHPHGDSSIYMAMVRLAQDWVMRYPVLGKTNHRHVDR